MQSKTALHVILCLKNIEEFAKYTDAPEFLSTLLPEDSVDLFVRFISDLPIYSGAEKAIPSSASIPHNIPWIHFDVCLEIAYGEASFKELTQSTESSTLKDSLPPCLEEHLHALRSYARKGSDGELLLLRTELEKLLGMIKS